MARRRDRRGGRRAGGRGAAATGAGAAAGTLPALSSLSDLPAFGDLLPSAAQVAAFERARAAGGGGRSVAPGPSPAGVAGDRGAGEVASAGVGCDGADELRLGCVVRLDRGFPAVMCADGVVRAEFAASLTKAAFSRVAVGDWVCVRVPAGHEMALIQEILPRESDVARWRGGARGERQTLAANVDVVVVVVALGGGAFSAERVARAAVVARDCGAAVAVVLTKADRAGAEGLAGAVRAVHEVLGVDVAVVVTCAGAGEGEGAGELRDAARRAGARWGLACVRALVSRGTVAIVLGESGAGKSTLLNALVGRDVLETGAVRAADDAGRHTTVARRMVALPGGGVIIDEPGLRSLPLVGHGRGLSLVFPAIDEAARGCRFRDCTHTHEPGCAVRAALAAGAFGEAALACYLSLAAEMRSSSTTLDPDVVL